MKKIALIILTLLTIPAFPEIEFHCYDDAAHLPCTERRDVNLSGFDSTITVPLHSNWYSTYEEEGAGTLSVYFWDDEIWEATRQKYEGFSAQDNSFSNSASDIEVASGIAFYQNIDVTFLESETSFSSDIKMILKIYAFVGDTKLTMSSVGEGDFPPIAVSKTGNALSFIQFGSADQACLLSQTAQLSADSEVEFSVNFTTCPISITAVDPVEGTGYQFTASFNNLTKSFNAATGGDIGNAGNIETELFNLEGDQVGYLFFDFFTNTFQVVNLNKEPFKS